MRLPKILTIFITSLILSACSLPFTNSNKQITLNYWGLADPAVTINQLIDDYLKIHPNVKIQYEKKSPQQYRETLQTQIEKGTGPDIFQFHNTWTPMLETELIPVPTQIFSAADFRGEFYPTVITDLRNSAKKFVGVPIGIDGLGLYYNEDLFQAAGIVSPPTNWQEFAQTAAKLTVKDTAGNIRTAGAALGTATNVDHFSDILALMIMQNGGDLKSLNNQRTRDTLEYYSRFSKGQDRVWDETLPKSTLAFAGGNLAMYFGPATAAAQVKNTNPLLKFKVAPAPQLVGGNVAFASYWALGVSLKLKDSKEKEEAWNFVKYLTDDQTLVRIYNEAAKTPSRVVGMPYPKTRLAEKLASDPIVGAYLTQAPFMRSFPMASDTFDNGLNDEIIKIYSDIIKNYSSGAPAGKVLDEATKNIQNTFTKYKAKVQ